MTRSQRLSASLRTEEQGILQEGVTEIVVPSHSENEPTFFNSLFVRNSELETGVLTMQCIIVLSMMCIVYI